MADSSPRRHASIQTFVDPKVKTIGVTDAIIKSIYAEFPLSAKVISGYLSEEQLYWKVNYHWEVLLEAVHHCSQLVADTAHKQALAAIWAALESNQPDPKCGYRKSTEPGWPKDKSSHRRILARHALVRQGKQDLKRVIAAADILAKSRRDPKALMLACAPVAKPAHGKHSTGFALDIDGNNAEIAAVARRLGATLTFDEGSHVHCEWAAGVDSSNQFGQDSLRAAERKVRQSIDSRVGVPKHCLLRDA
ncbi:MAG: hypothetical protein ABJD97_21180 [Betaproteobacteria bacterium]